MRHRWFRCEPEQRLQLPNEKPRIRVSSLCHMGPPVYEIDGIVSGAGTSSGQPRHDVREIYESCTVQECCDIVKGKAITQEEDLIKPLELYRSARFKIRALRRTIDILAPLSLFLERERRRRKRTNKMTVRHAWPVVIGRTILLGFFFVVGCISIVGNQLIGMFVFANDAVQKQAVVNLTKKQFIALLGTVSQWVSPCKISITFDPSTLPEGDSFKVDPLGNLSSILSPNSVLISNHQIYTDWLYLWFILYTAKLGDSVYIMLKDLSKIPVLGFGMKNYNFLFLSRKWEKDKIVLTNQLLTIDANARGMGPANGVTHVTSTNVGSSELRHWPDGHKAGQIWPYLVILYPEGTVTSARTRAKSDKFCEDRNMPVLKHTLLPRVRGLFLTLRKLRNTVEIVYDFTCGYSGLKPGEYGEDIYTLKRHYLKGSGPKKISYHLRGWKLSEIPLGEETEDIDDVTSEDLVKFEEWLFKVWYEKDRMLDQYYKLGSFVDPNSEVNYTSGKVAENTVVADFRINSMADLVGSFASITIVLLILRILWMSLLKLLF